MDVDSLKIWPDLMGRIGSDIVRVRINCSKVEHATIAMGLAWQLEETASCASWACNSIRKLERDAKHRVIIQYETY